MSKLHPILVIAAAVGLAGCQTTPPKLEVPAPLQVGVQGPAQPGITIRNAPRQPTQMSVESTPKPPVGPSGISGLGVAQAMPKLSGPPVTANLNDLPLPAFINTVYGQMLHVDYVLDPSLAKTTDLVTLQISEPQPPATFYKIAAEVLSRYGVAVQWDGHTVNLVPAKTAKSNEPPLLVSGRALPNVPQSHRPVFQLVQLHAVSTGDVVRWLQAAYDNSQLKVDIDARRNALLLSGPEGLVRQAAKSIQVLDRPYLRGSYSTRIQPAFIGAAELAPRLVDALQAEGYSASTTVEPGRSIIILPIPAANSLLVFAPDQATLDHVIHWAQSIDRPNPASGSDSLFYYQVQNTQASDIASVLNGTRNTANANLTMGSNPTTGQNGKAAPTQPTAEPQPATPAGPSFTGKGILRVDVPRNALIFRGSPTEWQRMLPLIKEMDRAIRQVMIQVTIAEVTLDNNASYGLNWLAFDNHGRFHGTWQMGTLGGTGGAGLSYLVDVAGVNRAVLTALASDNRVTILSTPRLMAQSGEEASIDVGTDVPTLSAQTVSNQQTSGNSNLLQSIQYRKTGIILNIKPTVYSDNRIDLGISLEVSQAQPVDTASGVNSPSIFSRNVNTSLSLMDGGSVVLGGLVSNKETVGNTGVPFLKDIPLLGSLFRTHSKTGERTELLIMIVPYIIDSDTRAQAVTQAVIGSLKDIDASAVNNALPLPKAAATPATTPRPAAPARGDTPAPTAPDGATHGATQDGTVHAAPAPHDAAPAHTHPPA